MPEKNLLFVACSEVDQRWLQRLETLARPLLQDRIQFWSTSSVDPGHPWAPQMQDALQTASAALVFLNSAYLESNLFLDQILPTLKKRAEQEGMPILLIPVRDTEILHRKLTGFKLCPPTATALDHLGHAEQDAALKHVAKQLIATLVQVKKPKFGKSEKRYKGWIPVLLVIGLFFAWKFTRFGNAPPGITQKTSDSPPTANEPTNREAQISIAPTQDSTGLFSLGPLADAQLAALLVRAGWIVQSPHQAESFRQNGDLTLQLKIHNLETRFPRINEYRLDAEVVTVDLDFEIYAIRNGDGARVYSQSDRVTQKAYLKAADTQQEENLVRQALDKMLEKIEAPLIEALTTARQ